MTIASPNILLDCQNLQIGYAGKPLLAPMQVKVYAGEFLLVVGPNGAGKSTWFRTVLGLHKSIGGKTQYRYPKPRISYVPQSASLDALLPLATKDVAMWGRLRGWRFLHPFPSKRDLREVNTAITQSNASSFASHSFSDLSGGQKQRALLAQLLASHAELVFLDEPTASMDMASETETYKLLSELSKNSGVAVVVITHTVGSIAPFVDRILYIHRKEGKAIIGTGKELLQNESFHHEYGHAFQYAEIERISK